MATFCWMAHAEDWRVISALGHRLVNTALEVVIAHYNESLRLSLFRKSKILG